MFSFSFILYSVDDDNEYKYLDYLPLSYEALRNSVNMVLRPILRFHLCFQVLRILGQNCHPADRGVKSKLPLNINSLFPALLVCDIFSSCYEYILISKVVPGCLCLWHFLSLKVIGCPFVARIWSGQNSTWGFLGGVVQGSSRWDLVSNQWPGSPQSEHPWSEFRSAQTDEMGSVGLTMQVKTEWWIEDGLE